MLDKIWAVLDQAGFNRETDTQLYIEVRDQAFAAKAAGQSEDSIIRALSETVAPAPSQQTVESSQQSTPQGPGLSGFLSGYLTDAFGATADELNTEFGPPAGSLSYDEVRQQIPLGTSLIGSPSSPVLKAVNDSGKVVATFYQDPITGQYLPDFLVDGTGTSTGGSGGGGGGGGGGPTAFDLAQIDRRNFETDREYNEAVRQFDLKFGEDARQFDTSLGENARQFDATNTRLNLSDVGNLGLGLGDLNLRQQQYIAEILRNPADFLARAFTQRGGESPFPEITQADLINKLSSEFDRIRGFVGTEMGKRPGGAATPVQPNRLALTPGANGLITLPGGITWNPANGPMPEHLTWGMPGVGTTPNTVSDPGFMQQAFDADGSAQSYNPAYGTPEANIDAYKGREIADTQNTGFNFKVDENGSLVAYEDGTDGPVRSRLSLVGEDGPELMINHGDGSFDIVSNDDLKAMSKGKTSGKPGHKEGTTNAQPYADGTLSGLSPDALGRLSLFDTAAVPRTTQSQLLDYARTATPPGVSAVASGNAPPTLDVTRNSSFALFSPQQYLSLTPDEQAALGTRLASENKSLGDFLYSSQRNFVGRPRTQRRGRLDVTA